MMKGKICLVTGGTSGIGEAAAAQLARQGATVIITGRNRARGKEAAQRIKGEFIEADFSSLASVRALADTVRRRHAQLHVLINNAGLISGKTRRLTEDGLEETFVVNHLATFLLTGLLRGLLVAGAPSRVVTVSSAAHRNIPRLEFDNLQGERRYRPFRAYSQSKLENILFTYELARRLEGTGVTATCLHPGVVSTRIWDAASGLLRPLAWIGKLFMISAGTSARSVVRLAGAPELAGVTGRYFSRDREMMSTPGSHDTEAAARLWEISEKLCARYRE